MTEAERIVFISHHSSQAGTARRLRDLLAKSGIRGWMAPDDIEPGVTFDQAIVDQVARSDAIILLLCAASDQSRHVKRELMLAEDHGKPIFPVRLEAVAPKGLAYWLQDYQWIDWYGGGDEPIGRLIAIINRRPGDEAKPARPTAGGPAPGPVRTGWPGPRKAAYFMLGIVLLALAGAALFLWPQIAGEDYVVEPGKWVSRREVVEITHPEMAPEMKREIERSFENDPNPEECISEATARAPGIDLFDPGNEGRCTLTSFDMAGGRLSGYLVCPLPGTSDGSVMQVTFRGTYTRTNIDMENDITIARPGSLLRLRARDNTRWVAAECAARP